MRIRLLPLLVLLAVALLAPTASASPAGAPTHATSAAKKVKPCKRKQGESKKRWLKRCKCKAFKKGETRKKFKKRCPGAKVPKRKQSSGGGESQPGTPAPPAGAPGQSDIEKVTAALNSTQLQYFSYSNSTGASDNERYRFCGSNFDYTRNRIAISGVAYDSSGTGTWQITAAQVNPDQVSGTATLHYVLSSYQSTDVDPPPPSSGDVQMSFNGSKVDFGGRVYDATKIQC